MSYQDRMRDTLLSDMARRAAREAEEARVLGITIDTDYAHSRNITGEPSEKNRTYRATDDCWKRGLRSRTVGTATDDGKQTVRVIHADGTEEIRGAATFGKENIHKKQRRHATQAAQEAHLPEVLRFNVGTIGNVE